MPDANNPLQRVPPRPMTPDACGRPTVVVALDMPARLLLSAQCGLPFLPNEIKRSMSPLLTYEAMAVVAGSIGVLAASHAVGAGLAVDIVLGIATVAVLGAETLEAAKRLQAFYDIASTAKYDSDFEKAGREFAGFITIVGVNIALVALTKVRVGKLPTLKLLDRNLVSTGWAAYIDRLILRVPRDKGILWSKIGMRGAERLALDKGLTSLEMLLKREGFYELYAKQFGTFDKVRAAGLEKHTAEIWRDVSRRYAANLEGRVTAFVSQKQLGTALSKGAEPVLIDELWEIAEAMQANPKITSVQMIDVSSGKTWIMLRDQILSSTRKLH